MQLQTSTMVVGLDTYHDPTQRGQSVAALVCSLNKSFTRYTSHVALQVPTQEMHGHLQTLFFGIQVAYLMNIRQRIDGINSGEHQGA